MRVCEREEGYGLQMCVMSVCDEYVCVQERENILAKHNVYECV